MVINKEDSAPTLSPQLQNLYNIGFALHWLKPFSKSPVKPGWTKGPRASLQTLIKDFRPGYNPGVRLGSASKVGNLYLAVVDLDVKSDTIDDYTEALSCLYNLFPGVKDGPHLKSGRGNGSAHYYILIPFPVSGGEVKARSRKLVKVRIPGVEPSTRDFQQLSMDELADGLRMRPAWEIQLLSEGRQAVIVSAIHPDTGQRYSWGKPLLKADDLPIFETLPRGINGEPSLAKDKVHDGPGRPYDKAIVFQDVGIEDFDIPQHHKDAIVRGTGVVDRSHYLFDMCLVLTQKKYPDNAILSLLTRSDYYLGQATYKDGRNTRISAARWLDKYELQKAKRLVEKNSNVFDFDEEPEPSKTDKKKPKAPTTNADPELLPDGPKLPTRWYGRVPMGITQPHGWEGQLTAKAPRKNVPCTIEPTLINLVMIFKNSHPVPAILRRDLFSLRDTWNVDCVWGTKAGDPRHGGDDDRIRVKYWLAEKYGIEPQLNLIDEALSMVALEYSYHSLQDYLNGLKWDGVPRVATFFRDYYGAVMQEPYLSAVSRKFFQACIMRAFEPGCDFDHVIVLVGKQGKGKTKSIQLLGGRQWTVSGLPSFKDKDSKVNIQGKWLCEFGELTAITRSGNEEAKDYISRNTDDFRPPYGRTSMTFPRSTIFIGTTDSHQFLSDTAGNRRFWPITIKSLDFDALKRDRDQLWAEAVDNYYFQREPWWLEGEADAQAKDVQESRRSDSEQDTMKDLFIPWFLNKLVGNDKSASIIETDDEIFENGKDSVVNVSKSQITSARQTLLSSITVSTTELFMAGPFTVFNHSPTNKRHAAKMLLDLGFYEHRTKHARLWRIDGQHDWMVT